MSPSESWNTEWTTDETGGYLWLRNCATHSAPAECEPVTHAPFAANKREYPVAWFETTAFYSCLVVTVTVVAVFAVTCEWRRPRCVGRVGQPSDATMELTGQTWKYGATYSRRSAQLRTTATIQSAPAELVSGAQSERPAEVALGAYPGDSAEVVSGRLVSGVHSGDSVSSHGLHSGSSAGSSPTPRDNFPSLMEDTLNSSMELTWIPEASDDLEAAVEQGARAARSTNSESTEEATPTMTDEDYEMLISLLRGSAAQAIVGRCTCCTLLWLPGRLTPLNSSFTYTLNREPIQWIRR